MHSSWGMRYEKMLRDSVDTVDCTDLMKIKTARNMEDLQLYKMIFTWTLKLRQTGPLINRSALITQAPKLHSDLHLSNPSDFILSKG